MSIDRKEAERRYKLITQSVRPRTVWPLVRTLIRDLIDALPPDRPFHACDKCGHNMRREDNALVCDYCENRIVLPDIKNFKFIEESDEHNKKKG